MPRVVKEQEYAAKRSEILDAAQRLVATKGYEQMTIQDILGELRISKGAFYHYFASKPAVLEAMIERMLQEAEQLLIPIVEDAQLSALEKFQRFFATAARWKSERKSFVFALMHVWYTDDNAITRQKLRNARLKVVSPLLTTIIHQGLRDRVLTTASPDEVAEVVISLTEDLGDTLAEQLLARPQDRVSQRRLERTAATYCDAIERVLGAAPGALQMIDAQIIEEWLVAADNPELNIETFEHSNAQRA